MTLLACISDTHQHHKKLFIEPCDILIHAGDFTYHGENKECLKFLDWYSTMPAKHKVLICGNHEVVISQQIYLLEEWCKERDIHLLQNSDVTLEGLKIWGSPYSVRFGNWAYGLPEDELATIYQNIPKDIDVLVTHGPAWGCLDTVLRGERVGSTALKDVLDEGTLSKLRLHVVGHIHESRGINTGKFKTVNAANCNIPYSDVREEAILVEL